MSRQKQKGSAFESQAVGHLRKALGDGIERRCLQGANDCGDVSGVYFHGIPVVIECKNHKKMELAEWCDEAEREAGNADTELWAVIHKRRGCGESSFGGNYVTMSLDVFESFLAGGPDLKEDCSNDALNRREAPVIEEDAYTYQKNQNGTLERATLALVRF